MAPRRRDLRRLVVPRTAADFLMRVVPAQSRLACGIAMMGIEQYLDGARLQMRRIESCLNPKRKRPTRARVFAEIHFYFTCWDAIAKRLKVLDEESELKSVEAVYVTDAATLKRYCNARHHLEHYDERLPGRRKHEALRVRPDVGNLHGHDFTMGGDRWDVSRKSLRHLVNIVAGFRRAIRRDAVALIEREALARRPPSTSGSR